MPNAINGPLDLLSFLNPALMTARVTMLDTYGGYQDTITGNGNKFDATPFAATAPDLDRASYAAAIQQAQAQALGGNAQGNATAAQQQSLADALRAQMAGRGPSLAQQQLQQATDRINAQAAGAIASQRGINPGLAARLVAQQQAAANQSAAGQSAMIRSSEQLAAQQQLAQALAAQRGQDIGQQQANSALFGAAGGLQNQQNAVTSQNSLGAQQINAQQSLGAQQINADVARQNDADRTAIVGGIMNAGGAALAGGMGGGTAKALGQGAASGVADAMKRLARGGSVPGRAVVPGDSAANDNVPAMLSPDEIVLPRSVTQAPDAPDRARAFVEALTQRERGAKPQGYGPALARLREIRQQLAALEKQIGGGR